MSTFAARSVLPTRTCTACRKTKTVDNYHKKLKTKLSSRCIECAHLLAKRFLAHVVRDVPAKKRCKTCDAVKPAEDYTPDIKRVDGLKSTCKTCCSTYARALRASKKGKLRPLVGSVTLQCGHCSKGIRLAPAEAKVRLRKSRDGVVTCSYQCNFARSRLVAGNAAYLASRVKQPLDVGETNQ